MSEPLLALDKVETRYGLSQVLFGISLAIAPGEMVTLMGRNGMGKTTTVRSVMGLTPATAGSIRFAGREIASLPSFRVAQLGIGLVPEGRQVFPQMTISENLDLGAYFCRDAREKGRRLDRVWQLFPVLSERRGQSAGTLSGGEQQMLAIGRCLMGSPELVMFDEPSLGLAPTIVHDVLAAIRDLNREGLTCVLVEQNVAVSLRLASRAYVLENGRITLSGSGAELLADDRVRQAYLGL